VYCHATCATDTDNISFVMNAVRLGRARTWNAPTVRLAYTWCAPRLHLQVFDVILKENLRKMQKADLNKLLDVGGGTGQSAVRVGPEVSHSALEPQRADICSWQV
jgi:hypothetical protein